MSAAVNWPPSGRQRKVGRLATILSVPFVGLGTLAYANAPATNVGAVRLSPAEVLGVGLIACGLTCLIAGVATWGRAAAVEARATDAEAHGRVNHWRATAAAVRRR